MVIFSKFLEGYKPRKTAKHLTYRTKFLSMTSHEQVESKNFKILFLACSLRTKWSTLTRELK